MWSYEHKMLKSKIISRLTQLLISENQSDLVKETFWVRQLTEIIMDKRFIKRKQKGPKIASEN